MKLKARFLLLMIAIFIGFMLITWFLSVQLMNKVSQQWGEQLTERQVMFDKSRTLAPLIREIALARQMAVEPAIIEMALHEHDPEFRRRGIAVMEKYRSNFRDQSYFAAFAQSGNYYFNDAANQYAGKQLRYVLSPTSANDKWFYATLVDGKEYQVNIDPSVHLKVTKAWVNVLIRSGNKTVGIIGTGIDLTDLIKETVSVTQPGVVNLFIDKNMAIQLHSDPKLIDYMSIAKNVGQRIKVDVLLKNPADIDRLRQVMLELERSPADIATLWVSYEGKKRLLGVAYLPEIGWYDLTLMDEHSLSFFDGMFIAPLLFGLALLLALLIFGWTLRSWILNPIAALRTSTDKVGDGDFEIEPAIQGSGEIAHLSQSFTRMAEFVRNSSLELEAKVRERTTALTKEVAERKRAEAELLRFKNVLDNTLDMIFMFDPESLRFVYVNQGAVLSMGYSQEELLGMTPYQIKPLIDEPEFRQLIAPLLSEEQPSLRFDTMHRRKDGTDFSVDVFLQLVKQSDGSSLFVVIMHDITEKKESEELIWQHANFDTLTGLPNRRMFHDRLEQEIKKSHRSGLPMALMMLDLDRFKEVNDTLGHAQGDVLLVEAARRITECVRESDTVARLGGDEFTVILSELEDINSVERIAQKIVVCLAAPFQLLQETVHVSASVGITLYPDDSQDVEALIKHANQAMYLAKNSGRNRFSYFTKALQEAAQTRLRLINDLRGALAGQQFQVFYQPIVTLATGAIYKAEALLRWQHPTRGLISPAEFIPVAEETGILIDIGDWVFREVASQAAHWRASYYAKFQISVNVSPVQFRHKGSNFKAWLAYLQELGLPGQSIVLEITEGLLLETNTSITDQLLAFRDVGIRVSLDDFGTGYSSLAYLKKFDIDYLKIDQSFVRNLADDTNDQALCEAIIVMAHKLGLKVIAEGVKTEQQRDLLAAYGCDYAQGWLYSKAVPPEQFEVLLREQVKVSEPLLGDETGKWRRH